MLDPRRPPPADYYADRVRQLIDGVEGQYSDLLSLREQATLATIRALSTDAIRLLARLWSRSGPIYRVDSLAYAEVSNLGDALHELANVDLIGMDGPCPADVLLARLTRVELRTVFPAHRRELKPDWIARICASYPDALIRARIARQYSWCTLSCDDVLARCSLLFFGDHSSDLATFVLEDLGIVAYENYAIDRNTRQFDSRDRLERFLAIAQLRSWAHRLEVQWVRRDAQAIIDELWCREPDRTLEQRRVRVLHAVGQRAERAKDFDVALTAYGRAGRPPARERMVRILHRLGDDQGAKSLLTHIAALPLTATERLFADGFGRRRPRLQEDLLVIEGPPQSNVECTALARLISTGGVGRHLENQLPLGMLGLAFWDDVFAPVPGAFVNGYQDRPLDLYWPDFRSVRSASIADRLLRYRGDGQLYDSVMRVARERAGVSSALVNWNNLDATFLERALRDIPATHWCTMFDYMLDDLQQARTGFPDLVVLYGQRRYEFVEIKGPGDQIRPEQRIWFEFFRRHDLPARVLRVSW